MGRFLSEEEFSQQFTDFERSAWKLEVRDRYNIAEEAETIRRFLHTGDLGREEDHALTSPWHRNVTATTSQGKKWHDPGTLLGYGNQVPQSWETREAGWERQRGNMNFPQFEVVRLQDAEPVGMTTLEINRFVHTAEFVMVLAPNERGKGHATEAARLTLDWAFHLAALRMVWLKVLEPNAAGVAAYEKAGFRHAGRLRQAGFWQGTAVDELMMDAIPEDFPGPSAVLSTEN